MKTVFDSLIKKIESFQEQKDNIIASTIANNSQWIVNKNKEQLLGGQNSKGDYLMPYSQDPFFKSDKAAKWYANWKRNLGANTKPKPSTVPDLYINGYFHNSISLVQSGNVFTFVTDAESEMKSNIESKYPFALGLQEKNRELFYEKFILPKLKEKIL